MFGIKKAIENGVANRVDEVNYQVIYDALNEISEMQIQVTDEEGTIDEKATLQAIQQKAQMTLNFVDGLSSSVEENEAPVKQQVKEHKTYARR